MKQYCYVPSTLTLKKIGYIDEVPRDKYHFEEDLHFDKVHVNDKVKPWVVKMGVGGTSFWDSWKFPPYFRGWQNGGNKNIKKMEIFL